MINISDNYGVFCTIVEGFFLKQLENTSYIFDFPFLPSYRIAPVVDGQASDLPHDHTSGSEDEV